MDAKRKKSTRNVKKTSTVSSNRKAFQSLNGPEVGLAPSRESKISKTMTDVELINLDDDEDEVQVVQHAEPLETQASSTKRASLPRKCKSLSLLPSQPQAKPASLKKLESLEEIVVLQCRKRAKVSITRLEDVDLPPNKPNLEPIPQETREEEPEPQEEQPKPQEKEPEPTPSTQGIQVQRAKRAASVLDLNFIPLSGGLEVIEDGKTPEEDFIPLMDLSEDENRDKNSLRERNEQEEEAASPIVRQKRKRVRSKSKKKRLTEQAINIDLNAIPLPDSPRNTAVRKPSLRQLVKARRRCRAVKKRESLLAANRGIPLIEEIVIEDDDEEVVVQQPLSASSPSQESRHGNSVFVNSDANHPAATDVTLEEGELAERTDDDEIQFVGAKAAPLPPSPKRLFPVAGSADANPNRQHWKPIEVVKPKKAKKKSSKAKRSPEKMRVLADKRRERRRLETEMATQTTPSLARVLPMSKNTSQNGSSPSVKCPNRTIATHISQGRNENIRPTTNYNRVWDQPPSGPNLPFVPTVHQVPHQFDFWQDGYNPLVHGHSRNAPIPTLYNPEAAALPRVGLRPIIIDGCNVAMHHGRNTAFSVQGIQLCVDYFLKLGHRVIAFVPENCFGREPTDPKLLDKLERLGYVVRTPGRMIRGKNVTSYDDKYIVSYATEVGGVIVSRDKYRDLLGERWSWRATIEGRLLQPTFVDNMVMFPDDPLGRWGPRLPTFLSF